MFTETRYKKFPLWEIEPISAPDSPLLLIGRRQWNSADSPPEDCLVDNRSESRYRGYLLDANPDSPFYLCLSRCISTPGKGIWLPKEPRNGCGTTSLAYILRYLNNDHTTPTDIDTLMRPFGIYSAPDLLVETARSFGNEAFPVNNASFENLQELIRDNIPIIALLNLTPKRFGAALHYVVVVSIHNGRVGIYNPWGVQQQINEALFRELWQECPVMGIKGWSNFMIVFGKKTRQTKGRQRFFLNSAATVAAKTLRSLTKLTWNRKVT